MNIKNKGLDIFASLSNRLPTDDAVNLQLEIILRELPTARALQALHAC